MKSLLYLTTIFISINLFSQTKEKELELEKLQDIIESYKFYIIKNERVVKLKKAPENVYCEPEKSYYTENQYLSSCKSTLTNEPVKLVYNATAPDFENEDIYYYIREESPTEIIDNISYSNQLISIIKEETRKLDDEGCLNNLPNATISDNLKKIILELINLKFNNELYTVNYINNSSDKPLIYLEKNVINISVDMLKWLFIFSFDYKNNFDYIENSVCKIEALKNESISFNDIKVITSTKIVEFREVVPFLINSVLNHPNDFDSIVYEMINKKYPILKKYISICGKRNIKPVGLFSGKDFLKIN